MRKIILILFILLLVYSCQKDTPFNKVIVIGEIKTNQKITNIKIKKWDLCDLNFPMVTIDSVNNVRNNFKIVININKTENLYFYIDDLLVSSLYLIPGDTISFNITSDSLNKNFILKNNKKIQLFKKIDSIFANYRNDNKLRNFKNNNNFISFLQLIEYFKIKFIFFINTQNIHKNIKNLILTDFKYWYYYEIIDYLLENYYWDFKSEIYKKVDSIFFSFYKESSEEDKFSSYSFWYSQYLLRLNEILKWKIIRNNSQDNISINNFVSRFQNAKLIFKNLALDISLTRILFDEINNVKNYDEYALINKYLNEYKFLVKNKSFIFPTIRKYQNKKKLLPKNYASDITLPDIYDKKVSISDFKGKVIYIDFWATWCPPCLEEMKFAIALQNKYKNCKDIVFCFIALEYKNKDRWKEFIKRKKIKGIQLYMEGQFGNEVAKNYMINAIPHYILIDKEGKIYSSKAKSPKDKNLINDINYLIRN